MSVPGGWVRLELEDLGQHSAVAAYPALRYSTVQCSTVQYSTVQYNYLVLSHEVEAGHVAVFGRLPSPPPASEAGGVGELVTDHPEEVRIPSTSFLLRFVFIYVINFSLNISYFQIRRLTVLSVSEKDVYMFDMVQLLSNFQFGE